MKTLKLLSLLLMSTLFLTSCETEDQPIEEQLMEDAASKLLKGFEIKRDDAGAYSIDFDVKQGVSVDKLLNSENNLKSFVLYETGENAQVSISEQLEINNDELKVGFSDTNTNEQKNITVIDDDIQLLSRKQNMLKSYVVTSETKGVYNLDFEVANKTTVGFVYNAPEDTYEIHLEEGDSKQQNYSRTFEKEEGKQLKIVFVNHNANAKTESTIRKPIIIIDEGEDG